MLVLIRHGSYSIRNGALDELGISQATELAEYLAQFSKPTAVYHSPSLRTTEMAKIIAERLQVPPQTDLTLSEHGNPASYCPPFLDNTYTVAITHLPIIREILRQWSTYWQVESPIEIPIASVFIIDPTNKSIQKLSD